MSTVYLALGSNVGDSHAHVAGAIKLLAGGVVEDIKCAPLYTSKAVGYTDQPDFLNTVITGRTMLAPMELLRAIKQIEQRVGRIQRFRWGPREIDIDIIFYGDTLLDTSELTIPHPRFSERSFVLQPLADLDRTLTDPRSGQTISELLSRLSPGSLAALTSDTDSTTITD